MKEISKFKVQKTLFILAIVSLIIAMLEGMVFYSDKCENLFLRMMLVIQNGINAFGFKATVSLRDAIDFAYKPQNSSSFNVALCYAYSIAVFTAPYCTIAFLYKMLEKVLRAVFSFKKRKNYDHMLIFGYNDNVKEILNNYSDKTKIRNDKLYIHIITPEELSPEERYSITKRKHIIHTMDCLKATDDELKYLLKKTYIEKAGNILLFEDSSVQNFSLLQMFKLDLKSNSGKIALPEGAKIFCRCEDESISRLIADYYDNHDKESYGYDLEIVSIPEMQINKMFSDYPLYSYYSGSDKKLDDWNVNMLIAGFGKVGQQALLQAMNLGVVSKNNNINIDVIDFDIENKAEIFANQLSADMFEMNRDSFKLKPDGADGNLFINFYNINVRHKKFHDLIKENNGILPYNYILIAIDNIDISVDCAIELEQMLENCGRKQVPIILRMDTDKRLVGYLKDNNGTLENVKLLPDRSSVLTIDMILDKLTDEKAKNYNHFYSGLHIFSKDENAVITESGGDTEKEWNALALFRRDSNRAAAYHEDVKEIVLKRIAKENGWNLKEKLNELLGTNGTLLKYNGKAWKINGDKTEFINTLKNNEFAYYAASLEHRRWCYFMLSRGWKHGNRSDRNRMNPCIATQDNLMKETPEMVRYDLMSLMAMYKKL